MKCLNCQSKISKDKRVDTKFCSNRCRSAYNGKKRINARVPDYIDIDIAKKHFDQIFHNCAILQERIAQGKSTGNIENMAIEGFNPSFYTKIEYHDGMITKYCFNYYFIRYGQSKAIEIGVIN